MVRHEFMAIAAIMKSNTYLGQRKKFHLFSAVCLDFLGFHGSSNGLSLLDLRVLVISVHLGSEAVLNISKFAYAGPTLLKMRIF